jgi:hypothetical protein
MPPKKRTARYRELTTAERMIAAIGPNPAALVRSGLSPRKAQALERAWERWDARWGFSWRAAAGCPGPANRERLEAGEERGEFEAPEPPGLDLF